MRRFSDVSRLKIAAAFGGTWCLGCAALSGWLIFRFFVTRDTLCPPAADFVVFCRANLVDYLGANLQRAGLALLVGLVLTAGIMVVASLSGEPCPHCGARRFSDARACPRCAFDPFA